MDIWTKAKEIISDRSFELFVSLTIIPLGAASILGKVRPSSVASTLPLWIQIFWALTLFVGSFLAVAGILARVVSDRWFARGLLIESAGMRILSPALLSYGITVLIYAPFNRGAFTFGLSLGLTLACVGRIYGLKRMLVAHRMVEYIDKE